MSMSKGSWMNARVSFPQSGVKKRRGLDSLDTKTWPSEHLLYNNISDPSKPPLRRRPDLALRVSSVPPVRTSSTIVRSVRN